MKNEELKILLRYGLWLLTGVIICFVGITGVFADTTVDTSQFFTVTGRKWSAGSLEFSSNPAFNNDWLLNAYNVTGGIYTPPNSYDYIEFSYFEHNTSAFNPCNSSGKFTAEFNLLFTSATFNQYVSSVKWGNDSCSIQERNQDGTMKISCVASPSSNNYTDIFVYYNDIQGTATSSLYISRNIGITCGLNTDAIINNDNANTQNIINNQNQNTQDMIDSQKACTTEVINNEDIVFDNQFINSSGSWASSTANGLTDYIEINSDSIITLISRNTEGGRRFAFYTADKTLINFYQAIDYSVGQVVQIPANAKYVVFSIHKSQNLPVWQIKTCGNGNEIIAKQNDESEKTNKGILGKLKDLFNFFNSDEEADISGLNNMAGWLPPGPLDSIINLPLNLFQALTNTLSGSCNSVTLNLPFVNQTLILPCFDAFMSQYLTGFSGLWTFIGVTVSVFILYNYLLSLYKWVDDTLTLRENNLPGYYGDNWGGGA